MPFVPYSNMVMGLLLALISDSAITCAQAPHGVMGDSRNAPLVYAAIAIAVTASLG